MGNVIIDMITRNLEETIQNLTYLEQEGLTDFLEMVMTDTFEVTKNTALNIIETGGQDARIPHNIGVYAIMKSKGFVFSQSEGFLVPVPGQYRNQPLGRITNKLYSGIESTPIGSVRKTRGKEVRIDTRFSNPSYIGDVHDGKLNTLARPFFDVASDKVEQVVAQRVEAHLRELDVTSPPPQFISTLLSRSPMRGIVVY